MLKASPVLAAAASPALVAKGCVGAIEFDTLKEEAGAHWARIREGVYTRLESMLRAKLGPNDLFVRLGEASYLVTMPTTEPDDVSAICTRVAFDLYSSFLGNCNLSQIQVNAVTASDDEVLTLKRIPFEKVISLAQRAGVPRDAIMRAVQAAPKQADGGQLFAAEVTGGLNKGGNATLAAARSVLVPRATFHFVPVWSVPNAAITTYACEPKSVFVSGRPESVPLSQLSIEERIDVEMTALHNSATHLTEAWKNGERFLLAAPISFDVLGTPAGRMEVLSACRDMPASHRPYLTFVLYDIPPGVAQTRLATMVTTLRPFCRGIWATVSPVTKVFTAYQGIGLRGVGYNLREFTPQAPFTPTDAEQLAQFARRTNVMSFLWGVQDKKVLRFAQDAGIQSLAGPGVAPVCERPLGMLRLSWAQVLSEPVVELWV